MKPYLYFLKLVTVLQYDFFIITLYDQEWEEIEKYNRDGSKKKVLRRIILTRLSPNDVERSDKKQAPLPVEVEEIDYDSMARKEIDLRVCFRYLCVVFILV